MRRIREKVDRENPPEAHNTSQAPSDHPQRGQVARPVRLPKTVPHL